MRKILGQNKRTCGCFFVCLLLAMVSVLYAATLGQQSMKRYGEAKSNFYAVSARLYQGIEEQEYLAENLTGFRTRLQSGALGEAAPMVWVEALEELRLTLELDDFFYEISPVSLLETSQTVSPEIQWATIVFKTEFKHDAALFQFFNRLDKRISVPYQISQLDVVRYDDRNGEESPSGLQVVGEIIWVSIVPLPVEVVGV